MKIEQAEISASVEDRSDPGAPHFGEIRGDLACMTAFELLQTMHYLRKCGLLKLETRDSEGAKREASCKMSPEGLVEATCGHLQGREAALTFAWWKQGAFVFEAMPYRSHPNSIPLQEVLLDAVRLADEIEARDTELPDRNTALEIGTEQSVIDLNEIAAVPEIVKYLSENPAASRCDLERALCFAPVTLGFALARLCEEGRVRGVLPREEEPVGSARESAAEATEPSKLFRLLLAFDPAAHEKASDLLSGLSMDLGCNEGSRFFDPSGVSFVRLRPPNQRLISITALPVALRNRFVFESLLPSLQLAIFLGANRPSFELDEWVGLTPPSSEALCFLDGTPILAEILAALPSGDGEGT